MAFNLTFTSEFKPLTFAERIAPLQLYKEEFDKREEAYNDLIAQTETWKDIANQENSPEAYAMYKKYSDDLRVLSNDFMSRGLNLNTGKNMLRMKRRYYNEIEPIKKANEALEKANALREEKGPDAIFEVSEYTSLDSFFHGKKANNKYQSKDALARKAATVTAAAMAELYKNPEYKKKMDDQYWEITQHSGGTYTDLMASFKQGILDDPILGNAFSEIRQRLLREAGIERYDSYGQNQIVDAINTGMYAGLDKPTTQWNKNDAFVDPVEAAQIKNTNANTALTYANIGKVKAETKQINTATKLMGKSGGSSKSKKDEEEKGEEIYLPNDKTIRYPYDKKANSIDPKSGRLVETKNDQIMKIVEWNSLSASVQKELWKEMNYSDPGLWDIGAFNDEKKNYQYYRLTRRQASPKASESPTSTARDKYNKDQK